FPAGRATGNHWGDAITVLETTSGTPYHFNFHNGDLGNFTVIGPSGSRKTVILTFLLAQASKLAPRTVYFDKDHGAEIFIRAAVRTPAMMYLFHRVEERLDGTPTIIVVDEGWKALDDEVFVGAIRDWEKTIRKRGGIVGFATQNARDALDSRIGPAIIEQAAT